ncbi:hypothetical protein SAMN02745165_03203 [Malonomonas rubra DSM 5091]|uniref:Uncharacterized protein n=1 Tax=Malonomonas rubra DSM 5091 TaxID=1122189 RepID=A0A1M6M7L2_MALRU|nr:hypothetical protein [Malonomonas rubra]SHJ79447.1 hypothetical protein SAMN02745165_03203 [Malonomonas rubra DSM 5091]
MRRVVKQKHCLTTLEDDLLGSFHRQFAENQNHHQKLLIQVVSSLAIVITGYAIVYSNISSESELFNVIIGKVSGQKVYSIIHLLLSYLAAQSILCLLGLININIGYGFRRDQNVNFKIRKSNLNSRYKDIFGDDHFDPRFKPLKEYLPNFNYIVYRVIITIQLLFLSSIILSFIAFENFSLFKDFGAAEAGMIIFLSIPILLHSFDFEKVHKKYIEKII